MGADAVGLILYTADGHISAHLGKADRPPFADSDLVGGGLARRGWRGDEILRLLRRHL